MNESPEEGKRSELVMPFMGVKSAGGVYDDAGYCAGWHMGEISARLELTQPEEHNTTIRSDDEQTADLVAMRHGYQLKTLSSDFDEYRYAHFTRNVRKEADRSAQEDSPQDDPEQ